MTTTTATVDKTPIMSQDVNLLESQDMPSDKCSDNKDDASAELSFLKVVATTDLVAVGDVESQHPDQETDRGEDGLPYHPSSAETPPPQFSSVPKVMANVGIFAGDEDDTASVFSFDSLEKSNIPLRVQNLLRQQHESTDDPNSSSVPFPSMVGASMEYETAVNVCPCRCLFFTLKETICLIMSALGCAVFLAGLVVLCIYLEGSAFDGS